MNWFISTGISLLFHIVFILFLSLNPWPVSIPVRPTAYTVTLLPIFQEPAAPINTPSETIREKPFKPIEKVKKDDIVEKVKKKEKDQESLHRLQEALEEIRKKAALDQIQKRISKREVTKEAVPPSSPSPSPTPSPVTPPALSSSLRESKRNEYYGLVWAKIKQAWTIPENLLKERVDLETIIVVIIGKDGRVQKSWFEKKSGNALYDQMAMRAILKAEPLPPIPIELNQENLEIGIRFFPD